MQPTMQLRTACDRAAGGWSGRMAALGYAAAYRGFVATAGPFGATTLLDVGSGAGDFAAAWQAGRGTGARLTLVDPSPCMLARAAARFAGAVALCDGTLSLRHLAPQEVILCAHVIEHLDDPGAGLAAMRAALAPARALTVFEITPLLREVIRALRGHGPEAAALPGDARLLFETAAMLAERACERPSRAVMPAGQSMAVRRALAATETAMEAETGLGAIAAEVAMTPRTLARRFRAELGMTWREARQRLRMIRACEALAEGDAPVTEVALAVGYASPSAFHAAFRAFAGMTPGDWRDSIAGA